MDFANEDEAYWPVLGILNMSSGSFGKHEKRGLQLLNEKCDLKNLGRLFMISRQI